MRSLRSSLGLALALAGLPLEATRAFAMRASAASEGAVVPLAPIAPLPSQSPASAAATPAGAAAFGLAPAQALGLVTPVAPAGSPAPALASESPLAAPRERLAQAGADLAHGADPAQVAARLYEGASLGLRPLEPPPAGSAPDARRPAAVGLAARSAQDPPGAPRAARAPAPRVSVIEAAELSYMAFGLAIASLVASAIAGALAPGATAKAVALGLSWAFGAGVLRDTLASSRRVVVGGWQASHDQKYRHGYDGQLRDIRGRKYGEDRYEEWAPGPTSSRQRLVLRLAAGAAGLGLAYWLDASLAAYGFSWAAVSFAFDALERRRSRRAPAPSAEDARRAQRFSR
ncbi:MAG: hypothetical protein HY554_02610 [Elusimicrobia bacterium]|nr:hypothetical protein [Elusimicrobiota bacterium]